MTLFNGTRFRSGIRWLLSLAALVIVQHAQAQSWQATAGAQSKDKGRQALAFLPSELWIHAGDTITWKVDTDENHTVTFLKVGQVRPSFTAGCPGTTPDGTPFDGSSCVNGGKMASGQTYTVNFPTPGNFRLVCLIHVNMTAVVHVLNRGEPLPHDQAFYDDQTVQERRVLLSDRDQAGDQEVNHELDKDDRDSFNAHSHGNEIPTGAGEIVSRPGGIQSVSLMRFMRPKIVIHVGETVEWSSSDVSGHTITFGTEPPNVTPTTPPSANVTLDADGARHATISSPSDNVHSGFIAPAPQERVGLAQSPPSVTRFRVTFTNIGVFPYICAFHDDLGMKGEVIVLP